MVHAWCMNHVVSYVVAPEGDPEGVDHARDVGQQGQQDVQQEVAPTPPHLGWGCGVWCGVVGCTRVVVGSTCVVWWWG